MGLSCGKTALVDTALVLRGSSFKKTANRESSTTTSNDNAAAIEQLASVRDQGIVVLVRIRPKSEKEGKQRCFLEVQGPTQLYVPASKITPTEKTVSFDAVLPATTSQEEVYRVAGPKLLHNVLQGFNATMIAYGQTGSGKTFTMEGTPQDPGVTPRLCGGLFDAIGKLKQAKKISVVASYVEIYNENVRDLLEPASSSKRVSPTVSRTTRSPSVSPTGAESGGGAFDGGGPGNGKPNIRENKDGVYVENVTAEKVDSEAAVLALLARGSHARTVGETQMNAASSRSHAVLMLAIKQTPLEEEEGERGGDGGGDGGGGGGLSIGTIRSKIALVDLAGSERAKSTGAAGQRLKEGAQINKSLSALGNVIKALTSGGNAHVPYRDSKLTRLLQDSLGGTAYTVVCCNVSPIEASEPETLSTLRFAERLKKVKNKMVVHMDARSKELLVMKRENAELKARVAHLEGMLETATSAGGGSSRGTVVGGGIRGGQLPPGKLPAGIRRGSDGSIQTRSTGDRSGYSRPVV